MAEKLRDAFPNYRILVNCGGGSFKSQFKKADKSDAEIAIILGEQELAANKVKIKYLRDNRPQEDVNICGLIDYLKIRFKF